jgi:bifunctional DNA-binding transcriptional regulator/antitoxin component of YhaV-PrlF toxin-antitoxin module
VEIRRKLGVGPGSVIEWEEEGDKIVVKRSTRYSSEDLHQEIFAEAPQVKDFVELTEGIRRHIRKRHVRR